MFHINWGWSGRSNGYFALTALNPSSLGAGSYTGGYNSEQMAIVGICPSDGAAPVDTVYGYYFAMTPTQETASLGDIVELNLNNYGIVAFGHDVEHTRLGISVEDESGRIVWTTVDECAATAYFSGVTYKNRQLTLSLPQSLADGRYRLRPVFAVGDMEARHFIPAISQPDGVVMAVDGGIIHNFPEVT